MSGINLARNINGYAQKGSKLSNQLALRLRDSEASILRDQGEFQRALNLIEEDRDTTPYSGAKFAYLLSMTNKPGNIDKARLILESTVLPMARLDSVDLEYVLRNAGIVAMKDGHTDQALSFFIEASDLCLRKGALHTKRGIDAIKRSIMKD